MFGENRGDGHASFLFPPGLILPRQCAKPSSLSTRNEPKFETGVCGEYENFVISA